MVLTQGLVPMTVAARLPDAEAFSELAHQGLKRF
jgi:hypothetical protein